MSDQDMINVSSRSGQEQCAFKASPKSDEGQSQVMVTSWSGLSQFSVSSSSGLGQINVRTRSRSVQSQEKAL